MRPKTVKRKEVGDNHCIWTQDVIEAGEGEEEGEEDEEDEDEEVEKDKEDGVPGVAETVDGAAANRVEAQDGAAATPGLEDKNYRPAPGRRGFLGGKEKKDKICSHLRKGYCHHSLSGKKPYKGKDGKVREECPFSHPRTCPKLLNNGLTGKYGCDGTCDKFHPKMCPDSLKFKRCDRDCKRGYHIRTNSFAMKEERKREEKEKKEKEEKTRKEKEERLRRMQQFQSEKWGGLTPPAPWMERHFSRPPPNFPPPPPMRVREAPLTLTVPKTSLTPSQHLF